MKKIALLILLLVGTCQLSVLAQSTRADLAQIRVGKDGNFQYWKQGSPVLAQLKDFVARVTDESSEDFVPVKDRIATFDVDGTLLCETAPFYFNWLFTIHRYVHDDTYTPSAEDRQLMQEIEEYILANHAVKDEWNDKEHDMEANAFQGMTFEEFSDYVLNYIETEPVKGLTNLTWGCALYWPMIEVVSYLVANDFQVFLCSGVDRDICRTMMKDIYDIPPYRMMTSDVYYAMQGQSAEGEWTERSSMESYTYTPGERIERGNFKQLCTAANKIVYMRRELGTKPILSWGNSSGDYPMFHYTNIDNPRPHISFCLLCDDTTRELGNLTKAGKCKDACEENGWIAVSMRDEWETIYGPGVERDDQPTAIRSTQDSNITTPTYNLAGQAVSTMTQGNVYIVGKTKHVK